MKRPEMIVVVFVLSLVAAVVFCAVSNRTVQASGHSNPLVVDEEEEYRMIARRILAERYYLRSALGHDTAEEQKSGFAKDNEQLDTLGGRGLIDRINSMLGDITVLVSEVKQLKK